MVYFKNGIALEPNPEVILFLKRYLIDYLNAQWNPIDPGVDEPLQFSSIFDEITWIRLQSHFHLVLVTGDINHLENFRDVVRPH